MRSPPGRDEQRTVPSSTGVCRDTPSPAGTRREDLRLLIDLFEENEHLHRQVGEMEAFLKDHGLVWIGAGDRVGDGKLEYCALLHEISPVRFVLGVLAFIMLAFIIWPTSRSRLQLDARSLKLSSRSKMQRYM